MGWKQLLRPPAEVFSGIEEVSEEQWEMEAMVVAEGGLGKGHESQRVTGFNNRLSTEEECPVSIMIKFGHKWRKKKGLLFMSLIALIDLFTS